MIFRRAFGQARKMDENVVPDQSRPDQVLSADSDILSCGWRCASGNSGLFS
jgi:hypothetical protein